VAAGGDEAQGGEGGEVAVDPAGAQGEQGVRVGRVVLQLGRLLALGLQLRVPVQQDPLLVGGVADGDEASAEGVGVLQPELRPLLHQEAHVGGTVGGEVELLQTLGVDADVRVDRVELPGLELQRPVLPGGELQLELETELVRHDPGDVDLGADVGLVVVGEEGQRRAAGAVDAHPQHAGVGDLGRQQRGDLLVGGGADQLLRAGGVDAAVALAAPVGGSGAAAAGGGGRRVGAGREQGGGQQQAGGGQGAAGQAGPGGPTGRGRGGGGRARGRGKGGHEGSSG